MRTRFSAFAAATLAAFCFAATHAANAEAPAALAGQVSSAKEGAMEGVVVSAKKTGGTITVSVVTDEKGRYSFPYGDFENVHRCAVLSAESRAAQYKHDDVEAAAAHLHGMLEAARQLAR